MKGHLFNFFYFLLLLGPKVPKGLSKHSMLEIHGDIFIFGGENIGGGTAFEGTDIEPENFAIYQITCSSGLCSLSTIKQELRVVREERPVTIHVPDSFCL